MSQPLVSVAVATYNGERFLAEQLETIYGQTWPHLEVVVSDDASTDGTQDLLKRFEREQGLRFSVNPTRVGLVQNFEHAIRACKGDYIALADQDDLWKAHKISALMSAIQEASLIYCHSLEILDLHGRQRVVATWEPLRRLALRRGSGRPTRHLLAENWVVGRYQPASRSTTAGWPSLPPRKWEFATSTSRCRYIANMFTAIRSRIH
jgi:glycosyltransferase involved in cell wall biosynthesis